MWEIPALAILNELRSRAAMKDLDRFYQDGKLPGRELPTCGRGSALARRGPGPDYRVL